MKNINKILIILLFVLANFTLNINAQVKQVVRGKILSTDNRPVAGAVVSIEGHSDIVVNDDGSFEAELTGEEKRISVWASGYHPVVKFMSGKLSFNIMMIPEDSYKYNEVATLPFQAEEKNPQFTSLENINKSNFVLGRSSIDRVLSGQVAGLNVTHSSGMPGEGSYLNLRGIKSFVSDNAPLIVVNGIPYLPDSRESQIINGYTRNIFQSYNINDIKNITVLKGASASLYGSLGANGVIMIETEGASSDNLDTKISYFGQYGVSWNNKRIPLLSGKDYNSYLSDIGMSYYSDMESLFSNFPFLSNTTGKYDYLYNNKTDWQDLIYQNGFTTDNLFRVEGGDAIAKYDLSLGYSQQDGNLNNTRSSRYHTLLNTNAMISKSFELFATFGLSYLNGTLQDQGMTNRTNPVLAAYRQSPLLSPYKKESDNKLLSTYAPYYYGISKNMDFATSNPLAIVNTLDLRNRQYDVNVKVGFDYKVIPDLTLTGIIGLYYNYDSEHIFVPGLTDLTIVPFSDQFGDMYNTVKEGIAETRNFYYNFNARYNKVINDYHRFNANAGVQVITSKMEYDTGTGRNTANDFYQSLSSTQSLGRYFAGYLEKWNWLNTYAHADYNYKDLLSASVNMSLDGSSSAGTYGNHIFVYPSAGVTFFGKEILSLTDSPLVNRLNLRTEYGLTGNSLFSSNLGKYYYTSLPYQDISGIVRGGISNTKLKPERTAQFNVGLDMTFLYNRLDMSVEYYNSKTSDVILALPLSSVFGTSNYYDNIGEVSNNGLELSVRLTPVRTKDFEWSLGGNIAFNKGKINSLGGYDKIVTKFDDGVQLITRVGDPAYQYYGFQTAGVYSTQKEADDANLKNQKGQRYNAGDVIFVDQNKDGRIDDKDRVALGSSEPKYFGGIHSQFTYKGFALNVEFAYSKGNEAYNGVRRSLESVSNFGNQSMAVVNRWNLEGQQTSVPRAEWGDPVGNNAFSDRWIEDASFLKMRNITLSYSFDKKVLNFFRAGTIYVTGENLLTMTDYLGLDPEFSYSSATRTQGFDFSKLIQPKVVKLGVNLKF